MKNINSCSFSVPSQWVIMCVDPTLNTSPKPTAIYSYSYHTCGLADCTSTLTGRIIRIRTARSTGKCILPNPTPPAHKGKRYFIFH